MSNYGEAVIMFNHYREYRIGGGAPLYELVSGDNPVEAIAERLVFATVYAGQTRIQSTARWRKGAVRHAGDG